ncbi:helix-turn-helix transcriptional regulator [Bradyrhizobium sp. INPA01-394B]|uniref:Helix-turn-helix transcriptional regulator n=2 Tax=Bradyrhizobium campsiandrae TaxID=1729892 RepID=A0ABR7U5C4_9BRAD|nr:helix-turn-helix transcriptional regulator [Bradyrhizobium campsiandrae]MBC9879927.1 helix-turn-helix transcriptional regulator [Bradyrhizobium campsiandrae]MBC9978612.1 helix-turn-helix transcriptional regulator [Bradyrhizobium campsiandrae]
MVNELLTAAQARAARAWLNWSKQELADRTGISEKTITRFELGHSVPYASTLAKMRLTFEEAGICFQFEGAAAKGIRIR